MARNLIIDQGNSRTKVSVYEGTRPVSVSVFDDITAADLDNIVVTERPVAAIYCSVTRHGEGIVDMLRKKVSRMYELTSMLPLPLTVEYTTASTLGRDRVAAAAGAVAVCPNRDCLIIDAGTAITYDFVTADRRFIGGNIAPGLWMRAKALHDMTSRLPMVEVENCHDIATWGQSTDDAIRAGVVRGVLGEIDYYRRQAGEGVMTLLTGGDSESLYALTAHDDNIAVVTDLVNIGLNSILLYNEQF